MLMLISILVLSFLSILFSLFVLGWLWPERSPGEISVRYSPTREIKEMTVNEFRELARNYLSDRGYSVSEDGRELSAQKDDNRYHVEFDFEAEASDPRGINGMMVEQKTRDSEGVVLFTLAEVAGQARQLADRSGIEIVEPETIIEWKRSRDDEPTK